LFEGDQLHSENIIMKVFVSVFNLLQTRPNEFGSMTA